MEGLISLILKLSQSLACLHAKGFDLIFFQVICEREIETLFAPIAILHHFGNTHEQFLCK